MISMTRVTAMSAVIAVTRVVVVALLSGATFGVVSVPGVLVVAGVVSMVLVPDILGVLLMASVIRLCLIGWGVARVVLGVAGGVFVHVRLSG